MKRKTLAFMSAFLLCASMIAIGQTPAIKPPMKAPIKPPINQTTDSKIVPPPPLKLPNTNISTIEGKITWDKISCSNNLCGPDSLTPIKKFRGGYISCNVRIHVYEYREPKAGDFGVYLGKEIPASIVWGSYGKYFLNYTIKLKDQNKYNRVYVGLTYKGDFNPNCNKNSYPPNSVVVRNNEPNTNVQCYEQAIYDLKGSPFINKNPLLSTLECESIVILK